MEYQEAAAKVAAMAICTEQVPIGCENCPAYLGDDADRKKQRQTCNDMLEPVSILEAVALITEYRRQKKRAAGASDAASNEHVSNK